MDSVDTCPVSIGMTSKNPVLMKAKSKKEYGDTLKLLESVDTDWNSSARSCSSSGTLTYSMLLGARFHLIMHVFQF